jgi:lincosamide nucleotidyltransferase A/C/D/E
MADEDRDLTGREVVFLVGALERAGVRCWLDGGWGVDALLGRQTRVHDDVDLVVVSDDVDLVIETLSRLHFVVAEDDRPVRLVLRDHTSRQVDVHPIEVDSEGTGWQRGAGPNGVGDAVYPATDRGSGEIEGRRVPCISPSLQLLHHSGYEPTAKDRADVAALCERFGLAPRRPSGY